MKVCSLKCLVKYCILISLTSFITTVVYHIFHKNHVHIRSADDQLLFENVGRFPRSQKIDWHDLKLIKEEEQREGLHLKRLIVFYGVQFFK